MTMKPRGRERGRVKMSATREKEKPKSRSRACGKRITGRMTTVFQFIISNGFLIHVCVSNIKTIIFLFVLSLVLSWLRMSNVQLNICVSPHVTTATHCSIESRPTLQRMHRFVSVRFINRIQNHEQKQIKATNLMNRLPVHTREKYTGSEAQKNMCSHRRKRKKKALTLSTI